MCSGCYAQVIPHHGMAKAWHSMDDDVCVAIMPPMQHGGQQGNVLQLDEEDDASLSCNTTKDQKHVRATTAGVLAVVWACGIVIGVEELFGAESRSQVYLLLMTLWQTIGIVPSYFFYDDACHLYRCVCGCMCSYYSVCRHLCRLRPWVGLGDPWSVC
jgi:hypothetical protein